MPESRHQQAAEPGGRDDAVRAAALEALPHGPAFRFVDEVTALEPGRRAAGRCHLRGDEPFFAGHFPGRPLVPGVILLEALAQLGGIAAQTDPDVPPAHDLRLAAVRSARIQDTAVPGETLEIEALVRGRLGHLVQIAGTVRASGRILLEAGVTLAGRDPSPHDTPPPDAPR